MLVTKFHGFQPLTKRRVWNWGPYGGGINGTAIYLVYTVRVRIMQQRDTSCETASKTSKRLKCEPKGKVTKQERKKKDGTPATIGNNRRRSPTNGDNNSLRSHSNMFLLIMGNQAKDFY